MMNMKRWQIILGTILISLGIFALVEALFEIDLWRYIWPLILVGLGLLLIFRPRMAGPGVNVQMPIHADVKMKGRWTATKHEIWTFVGSIRLDFTDAEFPEGEAVIKVFGFVPDITVIVPDDVILDVDSSAFVSEIKTPEGKSERFLAPLEYHRGDSPDALKKVTLQTAAFVSEVKVKSSLM
jgi:predicted membrane protein